LDSSPSPAKILVVDDHEANRQLTRAILEEDGYVISLAASGQEALDSFVAAPADCVLLDVRMPGLDGFAVCTRLRGLPGGAETPIIFLTAARDVDTFDRAQLAGGDDFLTKPVRPAELLARVQTALRLRRLDRERRDLFSEICRQRDVLTRLQLQKEQLAAFIVHDLKNPVGAIDLHAQLILRDRASSVDTREAAAHIRAGACQLLRLLLNLLDIGKAEAELLRPSPRPTDLAQLVATVVSEMAVHATAAELVVRTSVAATSVNIDPDLLHRTLGNLLENAIRHAPRGSEVSVRLVEDADGVELRVADAGPGVLPALREAVFERFVQLEHDEGASSRSGRGLGLTFCKLATVAQGGQIWIEDGAPGAVFCLRFPRDRVCPHPERLDAAC
jgi:two-component system sensor histidine kinase/response regulator